VEFDAGGPAAAVELDGDDVDTPVGFGPIDLFEVRACGGDEVGGFRRGYGLFGQSEGAPAAGLDFDEDVGVAVSRDYVDFALAGAVVGGQDGVAELLDVEARGGFACAGGAGVSRRADGCYSAGWWRPRMSLTGLNVRRWMGVGPVRCRASRWSGVA